MKIKSYENIINAVTMLTSINSVLESESIRKVKDCLDAVLTTETNLYEEQPDMPDDEYWRRNEVFDEIVLSKALSSSEKAKFLKAKETEPWL